MHAPPGRVLAGLTPCVKLSARPGAACLMMECQMYHLLWVTATALHDRSSDASRQWLGLLRQLRRRHEEQLSVTALCAMIFAGGSGRDCWDGPQVPVTAGAVRHFSEDGISYHYLPCRSPVSADFRDGEQRALFAQYLALVRSFRPDLLLGSGTGPADLALRCDAVMRGIPAVGCLDGGDVDLYAFAPCTALLSPSQAASERCRARAGLNAAAVGICPEPAAPAAAAAAREYITLLSPEPQRGLALLVRLALMAQTRLPQARFLVVDRAPGLAAQLTRLHLPGSGGGSLPPLRPDQLGNVVLCPPGMPRPEVYARTRVLLCPSLRFDGLAMAAAEASLQRIPCLASRLGALPETGAVCLDPPPSCLDDPLLLPDEQELQPWFAQLQLLLQNGRPRGTADGSRRAQECAQRAWEVLEPLLELKAGDGPQLFRAGSVPIGGPGSAIG